ncbi:hypothetical protein ACWDA7_44655 [Streptomyces sp. NPDC001156]|jgi:hypothetical protein
MVDGHRLPADDADRVRNGAANDAPIRPWYRDPAVVVPAVVAIVSALIGLVPYFFPQQQPDKFKKYVDPEECLTIAWPGPGMAVPQKVRASKDVAGYAILRQTPCWRAPKSQSSTSFNPAAGISVLCWVNADDVFDTSKVPRYQWYLVADPADPGKTIGWTPQWPYGAPAEPVPICGQHPQRSLSSVSLVAAALAMIAVISLIILAIRRRRRNVPHPEEPPDTDSEQP